MMTKDVSLVVTKIAEYQREIRSWRQEMMDTGMLADEFFALLLSKMDWREPVVQRRSLTRLSVVQKRKGSKRSATVLTKLLDLMRCLEEAGEDVAWTEKNVRDWFGVDVKLAQVILRAHERS